MDDDTQAPPEESGQVAEPVAEETIQEEVTEEAVPEEAAQAEPPPRQLTSDEIEERAFQRTASWMGRREKDLVDNVLSRVTQVLDERLSSIRPAEPSTDPADILDNPEAWARKVMPKIMNEEISRRSATEQRVTADIIRFAGSMMDSDPMFADKKFGAEVIKEIQGNFGKINRNLAPETAAEMLVDRAVKNVYRRSMTAKASPLSGNINKKGAIGTISAPATSATKAAPVKLDPMAKKIAAWFGNTEDEVREMLSK